MNWTITDEIEDWKKELLKQGKDPSKETMVWNKVAFDMLRELTDKDFYLGINHTLCKN